MKTIAKAEKTTPQGIRLARTILSAVYRNNDVVGDMTVFVLGKKAIIKGTVETREQKEKVTSAALGVEGIDEVENNLTVDWMC